MTRLFALTVLLVASAFAAEAPLAELVEIKPGKFTMGDKAETDATPHEVAVRGFLWSRCVGPTP